MGDPMGCAKVSVVVEFKELARTDSKVLTRVASGLFDRPVDPGSRCGSTKLG